MADGLIVLLVAVTAFVVCHFALSHRLRAHAVGALGDGGFQFVYSVTSIALLLFTMVAYHQAPHEPLLWSSNDPAMQFVYGAGSCFAATLFIASLFGNPALVGAKITDLSTRPPGGVFLVTRHPMMFAIATWSLLQIMITPTARNLIAYGGFAVLALVGSRLQDGKKIAQSGREWALWVRRTPFWPDLRRLNKLGLAWLFGIPLSLLVTWFEMRISMAPMGLWYFIPGMQ